MRRVSVLGTVGRRPPNDQDASSRRYVVLAMVGGQPQGCLGELQEASTRLDREVETVVVRAPPR